MKVNLNMVTAMKLASLVVHVEEMLSPDGHAFDRAAITTLLADRDVRAFVDSIDPVLLPVKRKAAPDA